MAIALITVYCASLTACAGSSVAQSELSSSQINGAGATFPLPVYTEWTYMYKEVQPGISINYQGIGSGGGKKGIIDRTIDFAGSDSLLSPEEYSAGEDLQMYPILAGAVVLIYNITFENYDPAHDPPLILDRQSLVDIYLGKIKNWNDPRIKTLNPKLEDKLPAKPITTVHRSDGSGTTEIFTTALSAFSPEWKETAGAAPAIEWPVDKAGGPGIGGRGNQGVAGAVKNTPNSIGYVELSYATSNNIPFIQMINKAGQVVTANAESLAAAMSDFENAFDERLTATIVDAPGENSWPIAGYTYIILHTRSMTDCQKAEHLLAFLKWALTDPQPARRAAELGYSTLPDSVRDAVLTKLGEVTCNSVPVLP
ncbi:MAG: phosphate ABC transporter substrate-binding protein PstS [Chloroflexota bacterium]